MNLGSFQSFCSSLNSRPGSKLKFSLCPCPRGAHKTALGLHRPSSPSLLKGASRKTESSRARLQSQHHRGQSETWLRMYDDLTRQVRVMGPWGQPYPQTAIQKMQFSFSSPLRTFFIFIFDYLAFFHLSLNKTKFESSKGLFITSSSIPGRVGSLLFNDDCHGPHWPAKLLFFAFKMHSHKLMSQANFCFLSPSSLGSFLILFFLFLGKLQIPTTFYQVPGEHRGVYFPIEATGFTWEETKSKAVNSKLVNCGFLF